MKSLICAVFLTPGSVGLGQAQPNPDKPQANSGVILGRDHVFV